MASEDGAILESVENPRALESELKDLRRLYRERSRCTLKDSVRYRRRTEKISRKQRKVAQVRSNSIHVMTTRLAKIHGEVVVEGMNVAGMMRQKGLPGARKRRRGLSDAAMGEVRRQLRYKVSWYGGSWLRPALTIRRPGFAPPVERWVVLGGWSSGSVKSAGCGIRETRTLRLILPVILRVT